MVNKSIVSVLIGLGMLIANIEVAVSAETRSQGCNADAKTADRVQLLAVCALGKAETENKQSIPLPGACRFNPEGYKPVRYIFNRTMDNTLGQTVSPVPEGLISYDFNSDQKKDYIFVEHNQNLKFRTIMCISTPSGWERQPLKKIKADKSNHSSTDLMDYQFDSGKLVHSSDYHERNSGVYSTTWTYSYSLKEKAFLLDYFFSIGKGKGVSIEL